MLIQFFNELVHDIVRRDMDVAVRKKQDIHVGVCAQNRNTRIVSSGKAVIIPYDHLAASPLAKGFSPIRIATVIHDHKPVRHPDPGNLFPDEPFRAVVLTIIDDNDT